MYDNFNYPAGADTPDAPWNQCDPPEIDIDVTVRETLVKDTSVVTNNAWYVTDEEGYTSLEDSDFYPTDEYKKQNELLSVVIAKAKEEISKIRIDAECYQRKLEAHYGVRHGCIPGCNADDTEKMKMREHLWGAMERVRKLKALEEGLDGWEQEEIEVEH